MHGDTRKCVAEDGGVSLKIAIEAAGDETVAHARIIDSSGAPIYLDALWFDIATGFHRSTPACFFKHGYQSWSGSRALEVGAQLADARERASSIVRINHRSEAIRPDDAPEAATSEWFTIVECHGAAERILAGFLGTAHALCTFTVTTPDLIRARAILDGVALASGATREIEPLYVARSTQSAATIASRWAEKLGLAMGARKSATYQQGWCSWYHYFHAISENAIQTNLRALAAMKSEFPVSVVQLDDGFQSALGDWDTTNQKFPGGLKALADEIRAAGFIPGLWTAPFLAARDSRVMREHSDWFIRHSGGDALRAGYNPNWTAHEDKFAYALDPSHPEFIAHLTQLFEKLSREFGYSYLKLDFLYAGAAEGIRHNPGLTRAEALRQGLAAIRAGAGNAAFILGCGCPLGPAIGIVDGMRIGPDVAPFWGSEGSGDPSTVYALDAIIARSFMHRRLWLNDPDCLMVRARDTALTAEERGALATIIGASGGMLMFSDDMALLGDDESAAYRAVAALGSEIDANAGVAPILATDLMTSSPVRAMVQRVGAGAIAAILNRGDTVSSIDLDSFNLGPGNYVTRDLSGAAAAVSHKIDLSPHSARLLRFTPR